MIYIEVVLGKFLWKVTTHSIALRVTCTDVDGSPDTKKLFREWKSRTKLLIEMKASRWPSAADYDLPVCHSRGHLNHIHTEHFLCLTLSLYNLQETRRANLTLGGKWDLIQTWSLQLCKHLPKDQLLANWIHKTSLTMHLSHLSADLGGVLGLRAAAIRSGPFLWTVSQANSA